MRNTVQVLLFFGVLSVLAPSQIVGSSSADATPAAVVQRYCELDMTGARMSSQNPNVDIISALGAWHAEPGWDSATVVRNFVIGRVHKSHHISTVEVRYTVLGQMTGASVTRVRQHEELVTFVLVQRGNTWKIERPLIRPHVSVQAAAAALRDILSDEKDPRRRKRLEQSLAALSSW